MPKHIVTAIFFFLLQFASEIHSITNNADLIWYEKGNDTAHNYFARQPLAAGLIKAHKIVVNQKFPVLWEVKFHYFDQLEELVIDNCGVNEIRVNTFKQLKPMTNLSIAGNNVKEIKVGVFNYVAVKNLNLSHNKISIIAAEAFDHMPLLEQVILDFNELKQWQSEWFFNCTNIKSVSITHNFLGELPRKAFKNLWASINNTIVLQDNEINLYFSYNKIVDIDPRAFEGSRCFGDFFLDWNDLHQINGLTTTMKDELITVKRLNLDGDSLRCVSDEFIDAVLNTTALLSIRDNPLECDCLHRLRNRTSLQRNNKETDGVRIEFSKQQLDNC